MQIAAAYNDDYALTDKSTFNKKRLSSSTKKSYPEVEKKFVMQKKSSDKVQTTNQNMSKGKKPRSFPGTTQSFLLEGVIPMNVSIFTSKNVIAQDIYLFWFYFCFQHTESLHHEGLFYGQRKPVNTGG